MRIVRFSTPKKSSTSNDLVAPTVLPWRDAILAGLAVAAAISLGAYVVYERAWLERVADVRHHMVELAQRLSRKTASPHDMVRKLPASERPKASVALSSFLAAARDNNDEVSRIFTFDLDDEEALTLLDTGKSGERPAPRPVPPSAGEARQHYHEVGSATGNDAWTSSRGLHTTAFSLLLDRNNQPDGVIGVEADADQLELKISAVRQALWFTCLLGLGVGAASGLIVWRLRIRAASAQVYIEENHRVEEAIISSLGEVIYTFDSENGIFHWRGNVVALLGFTPEGGIERQSAWLARVHVDDHPRYLAAIEKAVTESLPVQLEYRVQRGDGTTLWVLDRSHPLQRHDGKVQLVGSLIDLSSRRAAEETLRLFFDETATAHLVFDGDSIIDANPAAVTLFAANTKEFLIAQPVWTLWPRRQPTQAISAEGWSAHVLAAMESTMSHFEWQFARLDGTSVDCDVFLRQAALRGRVVLLMACYDISPAKRAQAQLIESEQRFRDVSEAAGEFIWEMDREQRYVYASRRVIDVLGIEPEALLGRTPFEFVPPEDREGIHGHFAELAAAGREFRNFENRVRRADGAVLWLSSSGVPTYDASGGITGYRGASLDVTKHRDYERELLLQKEAAESADRAKSSFLAMMSHEIRTPLNSVLGFADLVLETPLEPAQRDYLETIRSSGDALLVLLNDILDFSKIESGRMEIEIRPTDLRRCLREVRDLYHLTAAGKKLKLITTVAPEVPQYVLTDSSRLRQILVNLVGNAVKFTATGRVEVLVSLIATNGEGSPGVRIVVSDTGIGISPEQRKRLFKPFSQADSSTTRRFGGTGLGLAISRRLATLLDGQLGMLDHEGEGSSFYIDIPAALPSALDLEKLARENEREITPVPTGYLDGHTPHVLVVDDNTLNRRLTTHLLHRLGAETTTVTSAEECFHRLSSDHFDLVLMDVQMPVMDGLEATRHIRSLDHGRTVPIIALTADAMVGDRERCMEAGMNDYLTKPLRRDELARVLRRFTIDGTS